MSAATLQRGRGLAYEAMRSGLSNIPAEHTTSSESGEGEGQQVRKRRGEFARGQLRKIEKPYRSDDPPSLLAPWTPPALVSTK